MPRIAELSLYPVKSCAGIRLDEAILTPTGLSFQGVRDREWMVVGPDGLFLSQREFPVMATIRTAIDKGALLLQTDTLPALRLPIEDGTSAEVREVRVWDDILSADDAGDEAAAWLSTALGTSCRLVRYAERAQRYASAKWTGDIKAPTRFADGYPVLLTNNASLADLNARARQQGRAAVPMNRFRPNIVLDDIEAFEEDYAECYELENGIQLRPVKPCPRCPIPSVDQSSGIVGDNPVDILQSYRANPVVNGEVTFGMNVIVISGAGQSMRIGDTVEMPIAF